QDYLEDDRNNVKIDWAHWSTRTSITSEQAAKLTYLIEAKEGDSEKRKDPPEKLLRKVRDKAAWLDDHCKKWSLKSLVEVLGEEAPIRMREAASLDNTAMQTVESDAAGIESEPKAEVVWDGNKIKSNTYQERKASFEKWQTETRVNVVSLKVDTIFQQLKQSDARTWNIAIGTFKRDFWQSFSREKGYQKKSGRPPRKL
ncbi:hypothetical protein NP603_21685, partial [Methylomonas sp. SURF-1]